MSALNFTAAATDEDDDSITEIDPGAVTVTPSTAKEKSQVSSGQMSVSFSTPLTQTLTLDPGETPVVQGNEEADTRLDSEEARSGGTGTSSVVNRLAQWQDPMLEKQQEEGRYVVTLQSSKEDGSLTKACIELNRGENVMTDAKTSLHVFEKYLDDEETFSPSEKIAVFGDQPAPFPFLAVNSKTNNVVVLHGIRKFVVPVCYSHKNEGDTIAFMNDNKENEEFPMIIKLDERVFREARELHHPKIVDIINEINGAQVLPLSFDEQDLVKTTKLIPLPTFLVPFFMNGGKPLSTMDSFKVFREDFFEAAPRILHARTQYIHDFLLAATGTHDRNADGTDVSQVGIDMEVLPQDPVLMQWASTHFSSVQKIANIHDNRKGRINNGQMASPNLGLAGNPQEMNIGQTASSNQSSARSPTEANSGQTASSTQSSARSSQELFVGKTASLNQGSARIPTNASEGQTASHIQGSARSPDTANPILGSARSSQHMGPTGLGGMANHTQAPNQGNASWYQPQTGNMWTGGPPTGNMWLGGPPTGNMWTGAQQNQNLPPFPPYYNPWYPYHMMMPPPGATPPPGTGGNQPRSNQTPNTVSNTPSTDNKGETKEMFVSAFRSMFAEEINSSPASGNISSGGKSAKMLNGVNKNSAKGFCGKTFNEDVPEIFQILDGNENIMTKVQALEDRLKEAQSMNAMVKFTLRKELVKEFIQHAFHSDPMENNMLHGFTPFCIQQLDKESAYKLKDLEARREMASHTVASDFNETKGVIKIKPVADAVSFITAISNTRALAWALFTSSSPLTQDLHELYKVVLDGYQHGELEAANDMQPNWYAHVLWTLYKDIAKFFTKRLSEEDLRQGVQLQRPLTYLISEIKRFTGHYSSGVPPVLIGTSHQAQSDDESPYKGRPGKRKTPGGGKEEDAKKHKDGKQNGVWKENKNFDATLKTAKQLIVKAHDRVNLGLLVFAKGTTTAKILTDLDLPTTACGRYHLWGACGNGQCNMSHDDIKLSAAQIGKVKEFLNDGSKKLTEKKNKKD